MSDDFRKPIQLLALILNHELYTEYKDLLRDTMFPAPVDKIWKAVQNAHSKYARDLSTAEVALCIEQENSTLTTAALAQLQELLSSIGECPPIGRDMAPEIIRSSWRHECGRLLFNYAYPLIDDRTDFELGNVQDLLDQIENNFLPETQVEHITTDVGELLELLNKTAQWKFNLTGLQTHIGGLSPGDFAIFCARPELGKTAFWISLACGEDGWCHNGASVHALCNEEWAKRNMVRAVSAYTGRTLDEIRQDPAAAGNEFTIHNKIFMSDATDFTMDDIDAYCKTYRPDILIIDQLDKVKTGGRKDEATHERLRGIYTAAREIGKKHNCVVIGISQISADGEGKGTITYDMLEGSKTGKAAEADLILGIGSNSIIEQTGMDNNVNQRFITSSKNKLTGWHGQVICKIRPEISRYIH